MSSKVAADLIAQAQGEAGSGHYLVGAHDCTYKVFSSDWGLWKFCLACKRYDEEGLPRTVEWYLANEDWWQPLLDREGVGKRLGTG